MLWPSWCLWVESFPVHTQLYCYLILRTVLCRVTSVTCTLIAVGTCNLDVRPCYFTVLKSLFWSGHSIFFVSLCIHFLIFVLTFHFKHAQEYTKMNLKYPSPGTALTDLRTSFCHLCPLPNPDTRFPYRANHRHPSIEFTDISEPTSF